MDSGESGGKGGGSGSGGAGDGVLMWVDKHKPGSLKQIIGECERIVGMFIVCVHVWCMFNMKQDICECTHLTGNGAFLSEERLGNPGIVPCLSWLGRRSRHCSLLFLVR